MKTRAALRMGCAMMAMLLPLACLTRAMVLSSENDLSTLTLVAAGTYVLAALSLGGVLLLKAGLGAVAASLGAAAFGAILGAQTGDPFLMAVPVVTIPFTVAAHALSKRDDGSSYASEAGREA